MAEDSRARFLKYNQGEVRLGDIELVILDEATSAMDNLTEENVMKFTLCFQPESD